jgi:membrane protein DedA with SNARE-associated domain
MAEILELLKTLPSAADIAAYIKAHQHIAYLVVYAAGIPEGPVLTVVCGSLAAQGVLNPVFVYIAVVLGDMTGDSRHYAEGRLSRYLQRTLAVRPYAGVFAAWLERRAAKLQPKIESLRNSSAPLFFVGSKLLYGIGAIGLTAAGYVRFPYGRFVRICMTVSMCQSIAYLTLGYMVDGAAEWVAGALAAYVMIVAVGVCAIFAAFLVRYAINRIYPSIVKKSGPTS